MADVVAIAAMGVSLGSAVISAFALEQSYRTVRYSIRKELTDALGKLLNYSLEMAKYHQWGKDKDKRSEKKSEHADYPEFYGRIIADGRRFLIRQTEHFADQIPQMVSPFEWLIMADSFAAIDHIENADRYYKRAIEGHDNALEEGIALRQYAGFLFRISVDDGRAKYEQSLACAKGDSSAAIIYRADTYERWADREKHAKDDQAVERLYQKSLAEWEKVAEGNPGDVDRVMRKISEHRQRLLAGSTSAQDSPSPPPPP